MSKNSKKNTGTKSKTLISVKNLRVHFHLKDQIVKAVDDLSFDIRQGETLAIVGESGSGKSVTAFSLMRLSDYSGGKIVSGEINLHPEGGNVRDLSKLDQHSMREIRGNEISMIFQEPMTLLNPFHKVGDQIVESILLHKKQPKSNAILEAKKLMELVEIPEFDRRFASYPHELSGGQRQRIMIAMALANKPKLLIADEPTTALDVTIQAQILDLMTKLKDEVGMSILFITHDLGLIQKFSDNISVMQEGKGCGTRRYKICFFKSSTCLYKKTY